MLRVKQLPTADAVQAGKKAVFNLPLGLRYHVVWLRVGNADTQTNTLGDVVDDIVVKINGKPQRIHSALQLNALNGINGSSFLEKTIGTAGQADHVHYLPIFFAQPWRKKQDEVTALALRANGISSLQIEVNLRAAGLDASPNTDLFLDGFYEYDYDNRDLGLMQKFLRNDYSGVGTSVDIQNIDKRDFIESIHLFPIVNDPVDPTQDTYVTEVKFTANGEELRDRINYLQNQALLLARELVPDTTANPRFDVIFDYDDPINSALPTADANGKVLNEMTLKVTWNEAASGVMPTILVRTGPPE